MNKAELRTNIKRLRASLDKAKRREMDNAVFKALYKYTESYDTVLCYVSSEIEVDTTEYLKAVLADGKKVFVPRCIKGTNIMYFYRITSFDDLEAGYFGISEPKEYCEKGTCFDESSCCIVPALSYDLRGYRAGFGKGFYDRFLADFTGTKIGICYDICITEHIDNDEYDIKADIVITDKRTMQ